MPLCKKKYLYPEKWDDMFSFAFSREPTDRCVSMFYYLFWIDSGHLENMARFFKRFLINKKLMLNTSYAFDAFLDYAHEARLSDSIYEPLGNSFTTHTASMWDDITDLNGNVILKEVYRLDNLIEGINRVFEECGIAKRLDDNDKVLNKVLNENKGRGKYSPSKNQKKKIEEIYFNDFEVYEKAWH